MGSVVVVDLGAVFLVCWRLMMDRDTVVRLARETGAALLWHHAKIQEEVGLGPMETRYIYHRAYDTLNEMGLEVGGMIKPYRGAFSATI